MRLRAVRFQPVDPGEVADRLAAHVASGPAGRFANIGGPEVLDTVTLARTWVQATGRRRIVMPVPVPGQLAAALRAGLNLCPDDAVGACTPHGGLGGQTPYERLRQKTTAPQSQL
jgi:uncharacterized protein YbjT (DUF2867 family)